MSFTFTDIIYLGTATPGSGGGGSDPHNKGYFATPEALRTAYPTAQPGDFAIVESTDTVWVWDSDTSNWKDGDTKGQVTSVNGQTGAVTIGANDVLPSQTGYSGRVLGTDGFVAGWVEPEIVQRSTMPVASQDEEGNIYQFVGTTDANYTNGYFYKCVSDGGNPATYSWSQTNVQPAGSSLPSQTGNSGKFLTTDGTDASWATVDTLPSQTGNAGKFLTTDGTDASWSNYVIVSSASEGGISISSTNTNINVRRVTIGNGTAAAGRYGVAIGYNAQTGESGVAVGNTARANGDSSVAVGEGATATNHGIVIGWENKTTANYAIQIGGIYKTNPDANTFKVGNQNGNFEIMSADGTIPEARLADTTNAQQGDVLTLDSNGNAVWQAGGSGGGSVPTLTWYSVSTAGNTLTIADTSSARLVKVYKNGLLLQPTDDYTISGTTLTTVAALVVGDKITTEVF